MRLGVGFATLCGASLLQLGSGPQWLLTASVRASTGTLPQCSQCRSSYNLFVVCILGHPLTCKLWTVSGRLRILVLLEHGLCCMAGSATDSLEARATLVLQWVGAWVLEARVQTQALYRAMQLLQAGQFLR